MEPIINIKQIEVGYGDMTSLFDVSMQIEEGQITTVIGSNGSGKSTLLKSIVGILHPSKGSIEFYGKRIENMKTENIVRMGISLIPEGRRLFPRLTVKQNLILGAFTRDKNTIPIEMEKVFSLFPRLKDRQNQIAGTLSGGEQQMVAIARGLMSQPKVLMIDEMSLGLAPIIVTELFEMLYNIKKTGLTVLLVEQDVNCALSIADKAYVMQNGRVVLNGEAKVIKNSELVKRAYLGI